MFYMQARCDEKGFLAVAAFGLPGNTHEDGPGRALAAALAITSKLQVGVELAGTGSKRVQMSSRRAVAANASEAKQLVEDAPPPPPPLFCRPQESTGVRA